MDGDPVYTIMVVEDEMGQRNFICDLIEDENMDVVPANDGLQAKIYLTDTINARVDLILLDYNMPRMDGLEFLIWLRSMDEFKNILVIMMSTKDETNNLHFCLNQGAKNFFLKPLTKRDIKTLPKYIVESRQRDPAEQGKRLYTKLTELGTGGNAIVNLVLEQNSKKEYAQKIITIAGTDDTVLKQAKNEVELFKVLDSPFILKYIESETRGNSLFIYMEYAKNGELAQIIKKQAIKGKKFEPQRVLKWLCQCSLGLAFMHSKNIMHRDLKPQNLFLTETDDLKLGDFGISKEIKTADKLTNTFCGTRYYMPPEVYRLERYSTAADIWALGCTFYETMTLKKPFEIDASNCSEKNLEEKILKSEPTPPLSHMYPEQLRKLVLAMVNKRPEDRPAILEILTTDIIQDYLKVMMKESAEMEAIINSIVPNDVNTKRKVKNGNKGLSTVENVDKETLLKYPEIILAALWKELDFKTISNGWISKFYNAFYGSDFEAAFQKAHVAKEVKFNEWVQVLIKNKFLICLKGDPSVFDKDSVYTLPYLQDHKIKNDCFPCEESVTDPQSILAEMINSAKEVVRIYKEHYLNADEFVPYHIADFLLVVRLFSSLKKVDVISLNKAERLSYFLNTYQLTAFYKKVIEAAGLNKGGGMLSSIGFGKGATYPFKLGKENFLVLTSDEILNGVLRTNTKKFAQNDARSTLVNNFDKRILALYYMEHCQLQDMNIEKFDPITYDSQLSLMLKSWTNSNLCYNSVEKTISVPDYLRGYFEVDYSKPDSEVDENYNEEIEMILDVRLFDISSTITGKALLSREKFYSKKWKQKTES